MPSPTDCCRAAGPARQTGVTATYEYEMEAGHTYVQGVRTSGKIIVVNPGSVGLAREGHGEACYAVFQDGEVELKRIRYDVERTVKALRAAPLPVSVIEGLAEVLAGIR